MKAWSCKAEVKLNKKHLAQYLATNSNVMSIPFPFPYLCIHLQNRNKDTLLPGLVWRLVAILYVNTCSMWYPLKKVLGRKKNTGKSMRKMVLHLYLGQDTFILPRTCSHWAHNLSAIERLICSPFAYLNTSTWYTLLEICIIQGDSIWQFRSQRLEVWR